jgi:spore coat protein A, manganese oxidase
MKHRTAARGRLLPETTSRRKALWKASVAGSAVLVATVGPGLLPQLAAAVTVEPGGTASMTGMAGMAGMAGMSTGGVARTDASCPDAVSSPALSPFTEQLSVPTKIDLRAGGTAKLSMRNGKHKFHADLPATPTLGYAPVGVPGPEVYGGPTIEARRGVPATVSVTNSLEAHPLASAMDHTFMGMTDTDETAPRGVIHLHGAHSEPSQDGLPAATIKPGSSTSYRYVNDQEAAGLWYHDHAWGMTRLQVSAGLAGQYWLRDAYDTGRPDNPLGLPTGDAEIPLTLQDRTFNADGSMAYPVGAFCGQEAPAGYPNQWAPESFGDLAVVNGKVTPNLNVARGLYRFRLLNASNARFYRMAIPEGLRVYQIGTDGGLLDAPVRLSQLLLGPAERADLLVDLRAAAPGATYRLTNAANSPFSDPMAPPEEDEAPLHQLMQLTVTSARGDQTGIPSTLRGGRNQPAALPGLRASSTRTVMLNEIADPVVDEPVHGHINNQFYADSTGMRPRSTEIEEPKLNTVEEWDIVNTTGDAHPIHLHLTQFRILNRQAFDEPAYTAAVNSHLPAPGLPDPSVSGTGPWPALSANEYLVGRPTSPAANERGWKDTVLAPPGQVTRILVPFGGTAAGIPAPFTGDAKTASVQRFAGTYVFHCHILEHEDNDMMQPYRIR